MRTEKIGFKHFLYARKVLAQRAGPVKHILLFCSEYSEGQARVIQETSTTDLETLLSMVKEVRATTRRQIETETLDRFSLMKFKEKAKTQKDK